MTNLDYRTPSEAAKLIIKASGPGALTRNPAPGIYLIDGHLHGFSHDKSSRRKVVCYLMTHGGGTHWVPLRMTYPEGLPEQDYSMCVGGRYPSPVRPGVPMSDEQIKARDKAARQALREQRKKGPSGIPALVPVGVNQDGRAVMGKAEDQGKGWPMNTDFKPVRPKPRYT
jgi:hypothetical protein